MASRSSVKGYLLEEILAYLIRNTGYRLLVDPSQDRRELSKRGNGMVVQGRGGVHQVDVLGQLLWIPAFTFPIRLFIEAKCRKGKTGLSEVRNAVGIVNDINQNYSPIREGSKQLIKRYSYHYALFSTSGFSKPAIDYALAHQISLVDLSGPDFHDLHELLEDLAAQFIESSIGSIGGRSIIKSLRVFIRQELGTWPEGVRVSEDTSDSYEEFNNRWPEILDTFRETLRTGVEELGEFFIGMAEGPYLILLKPQDDMDFIEYVNQFPSHQVVIRWTYSNNRQRQWRIQPVENREAYILSFGLPRAIADYVFGDRVASIRRALEVKQEFLSDIIIYRYVHRQDHIYRLSYNATATNEAIQRERVFR